MTAVVMLIVGTVSVAGLICGHPGWPTWWGDD